MSDLPLSTKDYLGRVTHSFPRTPYRGFKAIANFMDKNFSYGSDENISSESWLRYPDQVKKYFNCADAGIMSYLLAEELGLDVVLLELEDFRGTGQKHLETVVRGSKYDYVVYNGTSYPISLTEDSFGLVGDSENRSTFSSMKTLYVPDVVSRINDYKKKSVVSFIRDGQQLHSYYAMSKKNNLFHSVSRFLSIEDNSLVMRKSFSTPVFYLSIFSKKDFYRSVISHAIDNSKLIDSIDLFEYDLSLKKVLFYNHSSDEEFSLAKAWLKNSVITNSLLSFESDNNKSILNMVSIKPGYVIGKKKALEFLYNSNYLKFDESGIDSEWETHKDFVLNSYNKLFFDSILSHSLHDSKTKNYKNQRSLITKLEFLLKKEGVNIIR